MPFIDESIVRYWKIFINVSHISRQLEVHKESDFKDLHERSEYVSENKLHRTIKEIDVLSEVNKNIHKSVRI